MRRAGSLIGSAVAILACQERMTSQSVPRVRSTLCLGRQRIHPELSAARGHRIGCPSVVTGSSCVATLSRSRRKRNPPAASRASVCAEQGNSSFLIRRSLRFPRGFAGTASRLMFAATLIQNCDSNKYKSGMIVGRLPTNQLALFLV